MGSRTRLKQADQFSFAGLSQHLIRVTKVMCKSNDIKEPEERN